MEMRQFQFGRGRAMYSSRSIPAKIAVIAFGIVLFLPILAMLIVAGVVAVLVFGVLLVVGTVARKFRSLISGKDREGRKNVRIKR